MLVPKKEKRNNFLKEPHCYGAAIILDVFFFNKSKFSKRYLYTLVYDMNIIIIIILAVILVGF